MCDIHTRAIKSWLVRYQIKTCTTSIEGEKSSMSGKNSTFAENNSSLQELSVDLLRLLDPPGHYSDAVIECGRVQIPVHKCILSARSPVFAAMFRSQMQEGRSGIVNIEDIEVGVLRVMLKYLYSGKTDSLPDEIAGSLLAAADKYGLQDLKRMCTEKLKSILSMDNVFNILVLGDLHDINLKVHAKEFLCKYKFSDFEESEWWKSLQDEYPRLSIEVLKSIVKYSQDSSHQKEEKTYKIAIHYGDSTISLDVKAKDTIQNVKKKIYDEQGIPTLDKSLFVCTQLQDNRTLSDYNIHEHSTLHLKGTMKIFVRTLTGKVFPLQIKDGSTINDVKKSIQDKECFPVHIQRLIFGGIQLEDYRSLSSYNIRKESTIHVVVPVGGPHICPK